MARQEGRLIRDATATTLAFDLDGTLYDTEAALAHGLARLDLSPTVLAAALALLRRPRARAVRATDLGLSASDLRRLRAATLSTLTPAPEVLEALARLGARHRLVLVSEGPPAGQRAKLDALGLSHTFERHFFSGALRLTKRGGALLRHALAELGEPRGAWVVGDDPARDIAPARTLGLRTYLVARGPWPADLPPPDGQGTLPALAEALEC